MANLFLQGEYSRTLDDRYRLSVPTELAEPLCEAGELTSFRTRGELYLQVHEHLTTRAARRLRLAPDAL